MYNICMSRTKRIYNKKNNIGVYHPYSFMCMGGCNKCDPNRKSYRNKKTSNKFKGIIQSIMIST